MKTTTRRTFLRGIGVLFAAAAIVRVSSIMPISVTPLTYGLSPGRDALPDIRALERMINPPFMVSDEFVRRFSANVRYLAERRDMAKRPTSPDMAMRDSSIAISGDACRSCSSIVVLDDERSLNTARRDQRRDRLTLTPTRIG